MSKFVVVKEAPKDLKKGEYLIDKPSFVPQIHLHASKKPRNGLTGSHYIRMVMDSIAQAYDPEGMTAYSVKAHKYEGLKFETDEDFNEIIVKALTEDCPSVFPKYLEVKVRARPTGTTTVIYVDSNIQGQYEIFYRNGLGEDKVEVPAKVKSDKVVGKPAVTKEEAEALSKSLEVDAEAHSHLKGKVLK